MTCDATATRYARSSQHRRCSTDSRNKTSTSVVFANSAADKFRATQVDISWVTTRKNHSIAIAKTDIFNKHVATKRRKAMRRGNIKRATNSDPDNNDSCTMQDIYRCQYLDTLEAIG